jgi:hypothetical protein
MIDRSCCYGKLVIEHQFDCALSLRTIVCTPKFEFADATDRLKCSR